MSIGRGCCASGELNAIDQTSWSLPATVIAAIYVRLGAPETAMDWLERTSPNSTSNCRTRDRIRASDLYPCLTHAIAATSSRVRRGMGTSAGGSLGARDSSAWGTR